MGYLSFLAKNVRCNTFRKKNEKMIAVSKIKQVTVIYSN